MSLPVPPKVVTSPRELDALVEEHVFAHKIVSRDWPCGADPTSGVYEAAEQHGGTPPSWYRDRGPVYRVPVGWGEAFLAAKFYSTDIAAAWQVVEKMRGSTWADRWVTELDTLSIPGIRGTTWLLRYCDTPEQVICLAALRARGVEVELRIKQLCGQ